MEQNTVIKSHKGKKIAATVLTVLCVLFFLIAAFCSGIVIYEYFITLGTGNNLSYGIAFAVFIIPNIIACALQIVLFIVNIFLVRPIVNDGDIKDKKRGKAKLIITGVLYVLSCILLALNFIGVF